MNIKSAIGDLKKIFLPITLTGIIATASILLGKIINHWFFHETAFSTVGLMGIFSITGLIIIIASYIAHDIYSESGHPESHNIKLSIKLIVLLLTLGIIVGIETLAAVLEHVLHQYAHGTQALVGLSTLFAVLIYGLSLAVYRLRRNFQVIAFEEEKPHTSSMRGLGLIIPLSTPQHKHRELTLPFLRKAIDQEHPKLDVQALLDLFGKEKLATLCASLRLAKKHAHLHTDETQGRQKLPNGAHDQLADFNWAMILIVLDWLQKQPFKFKKVHFLSSDDGKGSWHNSSPYMTDAIRLATHFELEASGSSVDFDDINKVYASIQGVVKSPSWQGMAAAIDVTGGKKPISIAGSAVAAHIDNCRIVYVDTHALEPMEWNPKAHDTAPSIGA